MWGISILLWFSFNDYWWYKLFLSNFLLLFELLAWIVLIIEPSTHSLKTNIRINAYGSTTLYEADYINNPFFYGTNKHTRDYLNVTPVKKVFLSLIFYT